MGGLVGFLLGYYVGAKDGPGRLEKVLESAVRIANSSEFQAVRASVVTVVQQSLGQLQQNLGSQRTDALNPTEAWKLIADSPEVKGLLATGASLLQTVLTNVVTQQGRTNGHAPL